MVFQEAVLVLLATVAAMTDVWKGTIPNGLTYPACVFGLCAAVASGGLPGLTNSLLGLAFGFVPFFALYLVGGMGGGDVKLMAAIGAIMGTPFILNAMITSILVGGLIALLIVIWEGKLMDALRYLGTTLGRIFYRGLESHPLSARQQVPFGVAICLGSFLTLVATWRGHASPAELLTGWL